jgi:hypothetical protein
MGREVEISLEYMVERAIDMCNSRKGQYPLSRTRTKRKFELHKPSTWSKSRILHKCSQVGRKTLSQT